MNRIWAPWRIKYVTQKKKKGCIFCNAFKGKKDKKNHIVLRSKKCFAIFNTFPYNNGHIMIVPNRHVPDLKDLDDKELLDMNKTIIQITSVLRKILKPDGFNIGINIGKAAGAGIAGHIHTHIVPRWAADTNFMPVLTDTKIISQSIEELYSKVKKELSK